MSEQRDADDGGRNDGGAAQDAPERSWRKLAVFAAAYGAEMARQRLDSEGIPVAVLNDNTGIFGPGFMGASAIGVTVLVASDRYDEARDLVEDLMETFDGEATE